MKIFNASQIKTWDEYTIQKEPIASIDLMERAASQCSIWMLQKFNKSVPVRIFCGRGNNGGDGLAIARHLCKEGYKVSVYTFFENGSIDNETNYNRLIDYTSEIYYLDSTDQFPILTNEIVIDAIFGTGLNKKPSGLIKSLIRHINQQHATVISIDIPSGLFADKDSADNEIIEANFTLSFQTQKLAFLMPENERYTGEVSVLDIKLNSGFENNENCNFELIDQYHIYNIYQPRKLFAHKGDFGYACLVAGSNGMMGAAIMSAKACLRSGVGKLSCFICESGYQIMQASVPEAMTKTSGNKYIKDINDIESFKEFDVIGIGPGIGRHPSHHDLLRTLFKKYKNPVVIDADALNVISDNPGLMKLVPWESILTPHPKEFERLFGKTKSGFDRIKLAQQKAKEFNIYIVLKGHYTLIATPEGKGYFNSTGNSGMATAGSGDVLTGILTGLLAQKYSSLHACILGVYLHGLAGDIASEKKSKEALIASDIVDCLGDGFKRIAIT